MPGLSRRDALVQGIGFAAAQALPAVAAPAATARGVAADQVLQDAVAAHQIPGVVAMAASAQSVIYQGTFGLRSMAGQARMSADTIFRIASMVKLLTSVAALQLVERGRLKLDASAADVDPDLAAPKVLAGFDRAGAPQLREAERPITLRQLLSHTAGFSYQLWDSRVLRYQALARHDAALPRTPLIFEPGSGWAYGGSIDRVGRMVEIASGLPLDRYFRDNITGPLGMDDTAFALTQRQRAREAHLHVRGTDGGLLPRALEKPASPRSVTGGGGIYSTAPDYVLLLRALLNGGSLNGVKILSVDTVAMMSANQIGTIEAGLLRTTNPALSNDVDFFPGARLRWGLGHMINLDAIARGRSAGSMTWAGLFNTYYWIDPRLGVAAVLMMQILPFADHAALRVYRRFEQAICLGLRPGAG